MGGDARLEVFAPDGAYLVPLEGDRLVLGSSHDNDVVVNGMGVSRLHAVLVQYRSGWTVADLSSRSGTLVNGERVWAERPLRSGDVVSVGSARITFLEDRADTEPEAGVQDAAPELTRREREVLVALCRPLHRGDVFTEPASIREIAEELVVTSAAVKQHLRQLARKFEVVADDRRRLAVANEAIRRGVITIADLR